LDFDMPKKLAIALLGLCFAISLQPPSWAETVLEKVTRTGVFTAGTATDAIPMAYNNDKGELVGYSIEMLNQIKTQLEARLGKPVQIEFVEVTPETRIPQILSGNVDIVCASVSFTWSREQYIDFSTTYGVTGTQLLVKRGSSSGTPESLSGKKIGVIPQTTNQQVIKLVQPQATLVLVKNVAEGYAALQQGKIDAFAWDGMLLEGFKQTIPQPNAYEVVPSQPFDREGVACMLPQNDSTFRNLVDFALVKFMQGVATGDPQSVAIFDRWFGANGVISVDRNRVNQMFQFVVDTHEQISTDQPSP
jgi:polar amino acid transport system substrate-binding protein